MLRDDKRLNAVDGLQLKDVVRLRLVPDGRSDSSITVVAVTMTSRFGSED
jgi:hypothetical protein